MEEEEARVGEVEVGGEDRTGAQGVQGLNGRLERGCPNWHRGMQRWTKVGIVGGGLRTSTTHKGVILRGMGTAEGRGAFAERMLAGRGLRGLGGLGRPKVRAREDLA